MDAADAEDVLRVHSAGLVEPETDMEKTVQLTQEKLKRDFLEEGPARNVYDLELKERGPYVMKYDRSGRVALLAGRGGHLAVVDQHTLAPRTEFFVKDRVRDACFLHDGSMMAVSQGECVYVYDEHGTEIHRMDKHRRVGGMEFLPYHWLLDGSLRGHTSEPVQLGDSPGPHERDRHALVPLQQRIPREVLCHKGSPITSLAIDRAGRYMATGGGDGKVKIFDLRTYKELHSYRTYGGAPTALDISQTGILGVGHGCHTTFWRPEALKVRTREPYMKHQLSGKGPLESLRFRPFEDVCGIGHTGGVSSIVIPGSGEPNLDSMEHFTNPYADVKQRREAKVRSLLEKLSPEMIAMDPDSVGGIEESNLIQRQQRLRDVAEEADARKAAEKEADKNKKEKKRMRGRSKIAKKLGRKQKNIVDENVIKLKELREKERAEKARERNANDGDDDDGEDAPTALKRFF
ncbi:hypothetical protein ACHAWF_007801 [Thalassiosira exigua]